jgi:WD40 repeat protein
VISKVNCVAFSPNDTCVVSGSDNRPACVWDVFTFKKLAELKHQSGVNSIAFSPDGAHIVSGTNTRTVCVWSAVTFEQLAELDGHQYPVNHVAFSRGNNVIDSRDFSGQKLSWICNNGDFGM